MCVFTLAQTLELEAHKQGRDILLALKEDIGLALHAKRKLRLKSTDAEEVDLAKATKVVRRDMLKMKNSLDGSFQKTCTKAQFQTRYCV